MSHNFKEGDLAMIVGSSSPDSPNVGKAVDLMGFYAPGDEFMAPDGRLAVQAGTQSVWLCEGRGLLAKNMADEWVERGGIALVAERYLMPLRGDFAPEQQKAKEAEPCA